MRIGYSIMFQMTFHFQIVKDYNTIQNHFHTNVVITQNFFGH
jgi:hypothetical protein